MRTQLDTRFTRGAAVFLLALVLILPGCDLFSDIDSEELQEDLIPETIGVFVANGGNFSDQNGSITFYDPRAEQAQPLDNLGAFLHRIALSGDSLYAITNTFSGGRLEVLDANTGARVSQVVTEATPRAIGLLDVQTAYLLNADFSGAPGTVSIYRRLNGELEEDVMQVGAIPEDLLVVGDKTFVANYGSGGAGTTLTVIDATTDRVTGTIDVGCDGPNELLLDGEGELIIVCQGKTVFNDDFTEVLERTNGQVVFLDPESETVVDRIALDQQVGSANGTQTAYLSPRAQELFVIDGTDTVLRFDADQNAQIGTIAVPATDGLTQLTAVAYDPSEEELYLGRFAAGPDGGADFTAAGGVVVLDKEGNVANRFAVGPVPSHISLQQSFLDL